MDLGAEKIAIGEQDAIDVVTKASVALLDRSRDPVVLRGQHPKMSGLVRAEFIVLPDLPETLRIGLFREPKSYPAWIRFSNGLQRDDRKPDAHGMAIKLMGVEGEKVLESERHATTQDFILVDNPTFFIRNPLDYAKFSKALLKAKGKAPSFLRIILFFVPGPLRDLAILLLLYYLPGRLGELSMLLAFGRKSPSSPLGTQYWSTTPYQFGSNLAVKYTAIPEDADDSTSTGDSPDFLREAMAFQLEGREATFSFRVQLQTNAQSMPIEDPTVAWNEADSPFVEVAKIRIPVQKFELPAQQAFGENLSFTPWHALPEHRPLGGINRTRRQVYEALSKLRHELNGVVSVEPTPDDLPIGRHVNAPLTFSDVLEAELDLIDVRRRGLAPNLEPVPTPRSLVDFNDDDGRMMRARVQALDKHVTGLSFSGGGIRAATFAIGFLQGLSSFGLLRRFDYLSTVSGGGYAGSWIAAWLKREGNVPNVEAQLCDSRVRQADADRMFLGSTATGPRPVVDEEPEPVRHLRSYSSYMTPRPGLMTADTWTVILIWLRNVSINMLMILPMVMLLVLGIRLATFGYHFSNYAIIDGQPAAKYLTPILLATGLAFLLGAFWNNGLIVGTFRRGNRPQWPTDFNARVRRGIVFPLMIAAILLTMPIRFVLEQLGFGLAGSAAMLRGPADAPMRIVLDFIVGNLGIFGLPNVVLHLGFFGMIQATGAWIIARRSRRYKERSILAGFLAGVSIGVLALFIEAMLREFGSLTRPDLMTVFAPPAVIGTLLVSIIVEVGLLGRAITAAEREWWARLSAMMAIAALFWLTASATVLYGPGVILSAQGWAKTLLASGWIMSTAAGILLGRSRPARDKQQSGSTIARIASVAPPIFVVGLVGVVALYASWFLNMPGLGAPHDDLEGPFAYYIKGLAGTPLWRIILAVVISWVFYQIGRNLIDVNLFSLNAMYANRITRCYLGASRLMPGWQRRWGAPRDPRADSGAPSLSVDDRRHVADYPWPTVRDPNPSTGFDPEDDIPLIDLRIGSSQPGKRKYWGPHLLINTTLNLVGGQDLAWRDRKGESFLLSPLFCGAKTLGYAELPADSAQHLTLGRAIAISGAAVDPNMSFYQSGMLPAFLTFFNARLGYWIENPSRPDWKALGPKSGDLLSTELTGQTDGKGDFVHLSDGGHFENMGVYELVRRRCRYIVALDAGEDGGASDENIAKLIRLCWIDFGVRIQLDTAPLGADGDRKLSRTHVVVGRIRYDDVDQGEMPGVFVYVKASMTGDESADIQEYCRRHPDFPHEATDLRQSFGEDQFESYRSLGSHIASTLFADPVARVSRAEGTPHGEYVSQLFSAIQARWSQPSGVHQARLFHASDRWVELIRDLRSHPELSRLSRDLYPELPAPTEKAVPQVDRDRAELLTVQQALFVMQSFWMNVGIDGESTLASYRGAMNSFRRWASTSAFRRFWPILRSQLADAFVRYLEDELHVTSSPPVIFRLSSLPVAGSFEDQALDLIAEEFRREWPEDVASWADTNSRGLPELIQRAGALGLESLPVWLIVQAPAGSDPFDENSARIACGIILGADFPDHPDKDMLLDEAGRPRPAVEFLVWVRRPYRSSGIGSRSVRQALTSLVGELSASRDGQPSSIWARYPCTTFNAEVERDMWLGFFARYNFRRKYSRSDRKWMLLELR